MAEKADPARAEYKETQLRNRVFGIRHGLAESNVQHVVVSDPAVGVVSYGLTEKGRQQAKEACLKLEGMISSEASVPERLVIVSSDFKQARETAEILHDYFKPKTPLRLEPALRERGLGELHLGPSERAEEIYLADRIDPTHTNYGCEPVMNVLTRTAHLLQSLDREFEDHILVLVAHNDPLYHLTCVIAGVPTTEYAASFEFDNCDIKELSAL